MSNYVLDTSALLAYIENEDGADEIGTPFKREDTRRKNLATGEHGRNTDQT